MKQFLKPAQKANLVSFLASHGGGYQNYLVWCTQHEIPEEKRFTFHYFRRWSFRRRHEINASRERFKEGLFHMYKVKNKDERVLALQESFERLDRLVDSLMTKGEWSREDAVTIARLEDQKKKTLEAIAREQGEYNEKPEKSRDKTAIGNAISGSLKLIHSSRKGEDEATAV